MRTALWLLLVALALCGRTQGADARLLSGFEDPSDLSVWRPQGSSIQRIEKNATQGRYALQLTLLRGEYPGLLLPRGCPLLDGWDDYDFARIDVFNPQSQPVLLTIRIDDLQSGNFGSRYNDDFMMRPGQNTIELPLHRLQTSDRKRNLNISHLKQFMVFASNIESPVVVFLDNFRLERTPSQPNSAAVRAFDFGPRSSPVMEGFVGVNETDRYDKTRGWGWIDTKGLAAFDNELPDSLCRDYVGPEEGAEVTNTFVVDVPNGTYGIIECTRDLHVTDAYRGIDHDWWPGKDVWEEEILPKFPEHVFRVAVTNGQIALTFTNVAVYWVAILSSERHWLESLDAARRHEFYDKYFYLEPYKPSPNPAQFKLVAARGQTVSMFFSCTNSVPTAAGFPANVRIDVRAARLMERPIGRGTYHIEKMALMPLANRSHAREFAFTVRVGLDSTPGLYHGEIGGMPVELRIWSFELPSSCDIDMTYGWYYDPSSDRSMRERELRDMVEHGFNSVTTVRPVVRRDGSLHTEQADEFLDAAQAAGLISTHPVPVETLMIARQLSRLLGAPEFSENFLPTYKRALSTFHDWSRFKPFPILAYVVDEPREQALNDWNRNFTDTKRYLELHRAAGLQTMVTLTGDNSFGKSYLPLLELLDVVSAHPERASQGILDATRNGAPTLWLYNAGMDRFTYGFYPWAFGAKGRWEWHYEWWAQAYDPFARTSESAWSTGIGAVMPSPDGPLPTVAYEKVRAGIDDYRYLWMLQRLVAINPQKGAEAARFLEELRGEIPRFPQEAAGIDDATMDAWREKIAGFIAALEEEGERNRGTGAGHPSTRTPQP